MGVPGPVWVSSALSVALSMPHLRCFSERFLVRIGVPLSATPIACGHTARTWPARRSLPMVDGESSTAAAILA
jgi:hypothetical protein